VFTRKIVHLIDKIYKLNRASLKMSEELGREPTDEELSEEIGTCILRLSDEFKSSAGVSYDVFKLWCRIDERFAQEVQLAEAQAIQANLDTIKAASRDNWPAAAWLLERRHPQLFARPEVQLNVGIQNNMNAPVSANDGNSFEMVVVSDLEYLGLRQLPNYEHHPDVRDVDDQVVPEELSGHLTRAGSPATSMILSQSEADAIEAQASRSREAVAKMFEQYRPRQSGIGNEQSATTQFS
jgi:hypothetical protein